MNASARPISINFQDITVVGGPLASLTSNGVSGFSLDLELAQWAADRRKPAQMRASENSSCEFFLLFGTVLD